MPIIKKIINDSFFKNNLIFFTGSMAIAVLNYLYHPVLGRMMDIEAFGEVQAMISLSMLAGMAMVVIRIIVVNVVANTEDKDEKKAIILSLEKLGLAIALFISFVIIILSGRLKTLLQFNSFYPFISLAVLLVFAQLTTVRQAVLQGLKNFSAASLAGVINSAARLLFAALLVYIGLSTFGAISALIIAQILTLIYVSYKTRGELLSLVKSKIKITAKIKKELAYGLVILFGTLSVVFLYTADVIIIKYYFPPAEAGLYSGIATIARIIFFITGSVAGVLLPTIKILNPSRENKKILKKAFFFVAVGGGVTLLVFTFFPEFITKILIGQKYAASAGLLSRLGLLSFLAAIVNLFFFYFLALRRYFILLPAIASPLIILTLSYFRHGSCEEIINNFILGGTLMLFLLSIRYIFKNLSVKRQNA